MRDGEFFLNDEPIYLRGVLLQPNYPVGLITPPTREMMEREIRLMKEAGFNMIRAHIRPAPPGYLDLTDEMGMLVYAESSLAWIRESPRWLDHGSREMRAHDRAGPQPSVGGDLGHPQRESRGERRHQRGADSARAQSRPDASRARQLRRQHGDRPGFWLDRSDRRSSTPGRPSASRCRTCISTPARPFPKACMSGCARSGRVPSPVDIRSYGFGSPAMLAEWQRNLRDYRGKIFVSELGCGGMADLDDVVAAYGDLDLRDAREMRAFRDSLHEGFAARGLDRVFGSIRAARQRARRRMRVAIPARSKRCWSIRASRASW